MAKQYKGKTNEEKQEQVNNLLSQANEGIKAVFESENYKNFLKTMAKFHSYSPRNIMLISLQKPEASHVAGYAKWKKDFKRQVKKGEKGIQIIGYTPKKIKNENEKRDDSGKIVKDENGKPITETTIKEIPSFMPMYVFDVSQTEGEPLPSLANELSGSVNGYSSLMTALSDISPYPIEYEKVNGNTDGYCRFSDQRIAIREGMSQPQTVVTAIHEVTHAVLHAADYENLNTAPTTDNRTKEVEAESVAFVVAAHYGVDTSDTSFPYLAAWSSDKELPELQNSLERIRAQASEMIDKLDTRLMELEKENTMNIKDEHTPDISFQKENDAQENTQVVSTLQDAANYGISVSQYAAADYSPPLDRTYSIYQMKLDDSTRGLRYEDHDRLKDINGNKISPDISMYTKVYSATMKPGETLSSLYHTFNVNRPDDFKARSVSVSDIIAVEHQGIYTANYINTTGFASLPNVAEQIKAAESSRYNESLDSVKFDNDIDADMEKTRSQLSISDAKSKKPDEKMSLSEIIATAKVEAADRNAQIASEKAQTRGISAHEREDF